MRTKKALINSIVNIFSYLIIIIPNMIMRKVFLQTLGGEMLGLNSLYSNIIGWLSIFELGIGSAIVYSLYEPYAENNKSKIRAYIQFYGKVYKVMGVVILILGLCISPFLNIFIENDINMKITTWGFILFLLNSFISYLFSHKLCILNVAQEEYKITISTTISKLIIVFIQIILLNKNPNFILFTFIQLIINFIYFIAINIYINKKYKWLNYKKEKLELQVKKDLFINIKALFMHKIGSLVVMSTDNLIISKFVGLLELSNYTNYNTIIAALQNIVGKGLGGITASIGSMLTQKDNDKAYDIHKKVFFLNFWIVSFIVISLYNTLNQFISLWVGERYLLDYMTFVVVLINTYFGSMRGSVEEFKNGSGNFYQDRYAPIFESIINFVISIILVKRIGLAGVFIGTLVSNFTVLFWTKPYVVYKYVFNKPLIDYFIMYFKYMIIGIIVLILTNYISNPFKYNISFISFIINVFINIVVINLMYLIIFYKTDEFKYYLSMLKKIKNR